MKVCLIAAPLMARSGVYRSATDLVVAARTAGHDWSALLAVRPDAAGSPAAAPGVHERTVHSHGPALFAEIRQTIESCPAAVDADIVVTLISQTDMVVSKMTALRSTKHVAWVRGLPWPDAGEQSVPRRLALRRLETTALRRADEVWATTPLLARQIRSAVEPHIVPAGIPLLERHRPGGTASGALVWAGRFAGDKGLPEFLRLADECGLPARVHGAGPLEAELRPHAPANVSWAGWADPEALWDDASMYVSTSHREAYGRCAVEAASAGLPVILSDQVGVAPFLFTDPRLRQRFVLPLGEPAAWRRAVRDLTSDADLRLRVSDHVSANASAMTIRASVDAAHARLMHL